MYIAIRIVTIAFPFYEASSYIAIIDGNGSYLSRIREGMTVRWIHTSVKSPASLLYRSLSSENKHSTRLHYSSSDYATVDDDISFFLTLVEKKPQVKHRGVI